MQSLGEMLDIDCNMINHSLVYKRRERLGNQGLAKNNEIFSARFQNLRS